MIACGIYKWTNIKTGRVLVGQACHTTGFSRRKSQYLSDLRRGIYCNKHFQKSFDKHGEQSFLFEELELMPIDDLALSEHSVLLTKAEQKWVDHYRQLSGGVYNQAGPVNSPLLGTKRSEETKEKLRMANKGKSPPNKGKKASPEARARMSAAHIGKKGPVGVKRGPLSDEHKAKISASEKGRVFSAETKKKISDAKAGKKRGPMSQEQKDKISKANSGRPAHNKGVAQSEETKRKKAESSKMYWETKRAAEETKQLDRL